MTPYTDVGTQDHILLEGYTHFDIIMAAANRLRSSPFPVPKELSHITLPIHFRLG